MFMVPTAPIPAGSEIFFFYFQKAVIDAKISNLNLTGVGLQNPVSMRSVVVLRRRSDPKAPGSLPLDVEGDLIHRADIVVVFGRFSTRIIIVLLDCKWRNRERAIKN